MQGLPSVDCSSALGQGPLCPLAAGQASLPLTAKAARATGFTYDELIQQVVQIAWRRVTGQDIPTDRGAARAQHAVPVPAAGIPA